MNEARIQAKYRQIRHLRDFKDMPSDQVLEAAKRFVQREDEAFEIITRFKDNKEKKLAKRLLNKYLDDFSNVTISDKNILKDLIYFEVVQLRLQSKLNDLHERDNAIPGKLLDSMHTNSDKILSLKNSLNLLSRHTEGNYETLEKLKKKFRAWRSENQGSRSLICPHCGKMTLLKIKTDIWETQKHPFFRDKILANDYLVKLYREKRITKQDVAKILEVSDDYIDWLIGKWYSRETSPDPNKQENNNGKERNKEGV